MKQALPRRLPHAISIAAAAVAVFWMTLTLRNALLENQPFDDSYMFYRYAMNIRHGLGFSWNLDGIPTYGETALLWGLLVLIASFLPIGAGHLLILGSWLCALGALVAMAAVVARNATSEYLRSIWLVLPLVALPVCFVRSFFEGSTTGMETMLAMLLNTVYLGLALAWMQGKAGPAIVGVVGIACFLTRPESALVAVMLPVLLHLLFQRTSVRSLATLLGVLSLGIALELVVCKLYFHTSVPLSFYMKSGHAYEGYAHQTRPFVRMVEMLTVCTVPLAVLVAFTGRQTARVVLACLLPVAVTFCYFFSVTQIMGMWGRYYLPYLPFFVVPSLLGVDAWLAGAAHPREQLWSPTQLVWRGALGVVLVTLIFGSRLHRKRLLLAIDDRLSATAFGYDPVRLEIAAEKPLPLLGWEGSTVMVSEELARPLPAGATVAASEVGYLSVVAPQVNVIDLAGLNDTQIALHGFSMDDLLMRKPDIIWMPHEDYTYQRGEMLSSAALLEQYELFAGAADYGLAIRRDSPYRAAIDRGMTTFWKLAYPGYVPDDYRVRASSWTRRKQIYTQE